MFKPEDLTWLPGVSTIMANAEGKKAIDVTIIVNGNNEIIMKVPKDWSVDTFWNSFAQGCLAMGIVPTKIHVQRAIVKEINNG